MLTVGTDLASSRAAVALAEQHPGVYAAVAIHPHAAADGSSEAYAALEELAGHPKVVAIGETGLDFGGRSAPVEDQRRALRAHMALAHTRGLPLVVHCREAHAALLEMLMEVDTPVVMHAFSGTLEVAQVCTARGYFISLAGPVTFKRADLLAVVSRAVPASALLVETDAPVLTPHPHRGRRNEPAYLRYVVERVAELRGEPPDVVGEMTAQNAMRVFGITH
jgi:TatD DNase family protein